MVAEKIDPETVGIGVSKCHVEKDVFDRKRGFEIAAGRLRYHKTSCFPVNGSTELPLVPGVKSSEIERFADSARKFFRLSNVVAVYGSAVDKQ